MTEAIRDKIWEAVEQAVWGALSVIEFKQECAEAWEHQLISKKDFDAGEWKRK